MPIEHGELTAVDSPGWLLMGGLALAAPDGDAGQGRRPGFERAAVLIALSPQHSSDANVRTPGFTAAGLASARKASDVSPDSSLTSAPPRACHTAM